MKHMKHMKHMILLQLKKNTLETRDKIAQTYLGLWGTVETQEKAQRRLNWMASQVKRDKVLDVGCSEGILAILLAREGMYVTGVDINEEAIIFARELLDKEVETVRKRVTFIQEDLLDLGLEEEIFDTVVIGEVLEHLLYPKFMLEKACSFLKPGGILVVTTPFGYFPASDHKQTFTLSNFCNYLKPLVNVKHISVEDGYIRFTGIKEKGDSNSWESYNSTSLLKISEQAIVDQQVFLRNQIERWKSAENKVRKEYKHYKELYDDIKKTTDKLSEKLIKIEAERNSLISKLDFAEKEIARQSDLLQQNLEPNKISESIAEIQKDQAETIEHLSNLSEQLNLLQEERLNQVEETIQGLRQQLVEYENMQESIKNLEKTNSNMQNQLDRVYKSRERAAFNYYITRNSLEKIKESLSYRLGQALVQAVIKPGKNTLLLPVRLASLLSLGIYKNMRKADSGIINPLIKLPGGRENNISFATNKPQYVFKEGDKIIFSLPEGESAYISSKENFNFSMPPIQNIFALKQNTLYGVTCRVECSKDTRISLWLIEYDENERLSENKVELNSGVIKTTFKTHLNHKFLCMAFRLEGMGFLNILDLTLDENNSKSLHEISDRLLEKKQAIRDDENKKNLLINHIKEKYQKILSKPIQKRDLKFNPNSPFHKGKINLLKNGFNPKIIHDIINYQPRPECIFYLLHSSLPYISSGYAVRSQEILSSMSSKGLDIYGVSRLGFPWDLKKINSSGASEREKIDNVTYLRLPAKGAGFSQIPMDKYMGRYLEEVLLLSKKYKPSIIHAASNYVDGNVAANAAKALGVPSIYEVRGLWEITRISREPWWEASDEYAMCVKMETEACLKADAVIAITPALKNYLVSQRGIPEQKITVVPNGVNTIRFVPQPRNKELETKFKLTDKTVVGFVGSMVEYEGLDLLLDAAKILFLSRDDFRILLVGDGRSYEQLRKKVADSSLEDKVIFTGRVPHDKVESYYSLIDIAPFPRKGSLVCELISPLKPFEAMAMEKCVVASDVAALAEIIQHEKTGMLFKKDDVNELAKTLKVLLDNPLLRKELSSSSRKWVVSERDWKQSAAKIHDLYLNLLNCSNFKESGVINYCEGR